MDVEETFDITRLVEPGKNKEISFDYGSKWIENPVPPRIINFDSQGVRRFEGNVNFTLYGAAYWEGGQYSDVYSMPVEIFLPVIIVHGWTGEQFFASIPLRIYESLEDSLKDQGYTTDHSWYKTLWYDTYNSDRINAMEVAEWLDSMIKDAIESTYANKVNIVGHSLGGLVGRHYIANYGGGSICKLIMVGTPNAGSSDFYIRTSKDTLDDIWERLEQSPLACWMIPTYPALYDHIDWHYIPSPVTNCFTSVSMSESVTYYSIYNTAIDTPSGLTVKPYHGYIKVVDKKFDQADGDGIVPAHSSYMDGIENRPKDIPGAKHAFLPNNKDIQDTIFECLIE